MGNWETFFLIRALQFLLRWITSNEKNREIKVKKLLREEIVILDGRLNKVVDILHERYTEADE